jgi:hypothetical protein
VFFFLPCCCCFLFIYYRNSDTPHNCISTFFVLVFWRRIAISKKKNSSYQRWKFLFTTEFLPQLDRDIRYSYIAAFFFVSFPKKKKPLLHLTIFFFHHRKWPLMVLCWNMIDNGRRSPSFSTISLFLLV